MTDLITFPGTVEWTGENPGIALKSDPDGRFVSLAYFFRVMLSPHGPGHVLLLLQSPDEANPASELGNYLLTDNDDLADYILSDFVAYFGTFKGLPGMSNLARRHIVSVARNGDGVTSYGETIKASGMTVELSWRQLTPPFVFALPPSESATGRHHMTSLFIGCGDQSITVDGRILPGTPVARETAGHSHTSAFLAFSETWIRSKSSEA